VTKFLAAEIIITNYESIGNIITNYEEFFVTVFVFSYYCLLIIERFIYISKKSLIQSSI